MGGLRKYMPKTFWTFLIAAGALSGIPLLSGFWSKDEILAGAGGLGLSNGAPGSYHVILLMGLLCAAMTAAYMTRCVYLTFFGEYRGGESLAQLAEEGVVPLDDQDRFAAGDAREMAEDDVAHPAGVPVTPEPVPAHAVAHEVHAEELAHAGGGGGHGGHDAHGHDAHGHGGLPHESGPRITVPLMILAAMSFLTMFANIPHYFSIFPESWQLRFEHFVEPVGDYFVPDLAHAEFSPALALISIALAAIGIGLGVPVLLREGPPL